MPRRTLLDFYADLPATTGEFLAYDDGYRTWTFTYAEVRQRATAFAAALQAAGVGVSEKAAIWSENRAEWIIALWGCLLERVVVVPIDYRASPEFLLRVADIVDARLILVGDTVAVEALGTSRPIWKLSELPSRQKPVAPAAAAPPAPADETAEIIFTSGATADPKGVVITHRNILANIVPIEREFAKYRKYARPFLPLRFLNLLPLSHMFGQSMAAFIPPMLEGVVIFTRSYAPEDIVRQIRGRRVSVLVCVPKMLEVLRDYVVRIAPDTANAPAAKTHWTKRWWRYRRVHRLFGFKFWAMVVGAAPLDPELEAFWGRLGFMVIQGYGLTETAPIVTLNHPMQAGRGAVGKPIPGVEVRIADDGEILVRGENVTRGYYNAPEATEAAFKDGWFHTGDIGEIDDQGRLHIKGRKKEMIVTPEGLNVFPEDVERVLNALPGVRESAVVGAPGPGAAAERVHAVVVAEPDVDLDDVVREANRQLQDHQRIRSAVRWTQPELPRTEGTRKLKRRELKNWLAGQGPTAAVPARAEGRSVAAVVERFAPGRAVTPETTIEELGLSSLERVELLMALEETFQVTVDETRFAAATRVTDLEALTRPIDAPDAPVTSVAAEPIAFPSWNRSAPARALRRVSLPTWILPLAHLFMEMHVSGLEHLERVAGPVVLAANHQSHFDTPAILQALPPRWRYCVAPAMAKEFFKAHFYPEQFPRKARFTNSLNYYLASLFFNAFPLPQRETGTRQTLRYIGQLLEEGFSVLIYPEGRRTERGEIGPFQAGVAMIGARLQVPVVPVRLEGLDRVLYLHAKFPTRGPVHVRFGAPILLSGNDYAALAEQVERAVRALA